MPTNTPVPSTDAQAREFDKRPAIQIVSRGGRDGELSLKGLDLRELELAEGAIRGGHHWVRCKDGRLEHVPSYEPLPQPAEDEAMMPFWRRPAQDTPVQLSLFAFEPVPAWSSPSITIGSLCGYNYSAENYAHQAANLTRWGFECLRSRRHENGQYWEHWYLPGLWTAKEELKEAIDALDPFINQRNTTEEFLREMLGPDKPKKPPKTETERQKRALHTAVSFLCRNAEFGTLDVCVQRAAAVISD